MTQLPMVDVPEKKRALGQLLAQKIALPLAGVSLRAKVVDRVAQVDVEQKFQNTLTEPLEAVYVFPLAGGAAVSRFELHVGEKVVKGRIEERGEARRQYQEAIAEGKRAGLLEQERDDVFTVQVGNIVPGEEITVMISYSERLPFFEDGKTELRLPTVVAPRYIAGDVIDRQQAGHGVADDTDKVPDASRITPPRLAPGFDPKVALQIEAELFGGAFADLASSQHATRTALTPESIRVALSRTDEPLDRDFVLRWKLAGEKVVTTVLTNEGYALLSIVPPAREGYLGTPRDVVFVMDRSGSMQGEKMASAARACGLLLRTLQPRDRFALQAFDDVLEWMPGGFHAADEGGIEAGEKWLRSIESRGGTELGLAMRGALKEIAKLGDSEGRVPVVALLTDGQVGDESSVLKRLQKELGDARVFTVGIDTAVNDGFLRRLAALGGGTASFVEPGTGLEEALQAVAREIGSPLITGLKVTGEIGQLTPARVPDLFAGRAAAVLFRTSGGTVTVTGTYADGSAFKETVEPRQAPLTAIAHLWARSRVTDLEDQFRAQPSDEVRSELIELSKKHTVLTRFTAFVATDDEVVAHTPPRTVVQPVAMPAKWAKMVGGGMPAMRMAAPAAPPPPHSAKRPGSILSKIADAFSGGPEEEEASAPVMASYQATSADDYVDPVTPAQRKAVGDAVEKLVAAWKARDVAGLEKARKELLLALKASVELAAELPLLQKFVRMPLVEVIAALKAGAADATFAKHAAAFEAARAEARAAIAPGRAGAGTFWEASI